MKKTNKFTAGERTQTTLHHYSFNLTIEGSKEAYAAMVKKIKANKEGRGRQMHFLGNHFNHSKAGTSEPVTIELDCIFDNQWNSTTDRLFDWFEEAVFDNGRENENIKRGHWLEITPIMAWARQECHKCGYCGHQYGPLHEMPIPADGFCRKCLDSAYLKESDLHLLRLLPLTDDKARQPLTAAEREALLPLYISRQTTGNDSRAKAVRDQERARVVKEYDEFMSDKVKQATIKRDGLLWLWDRGFSLANVIYYTHTGVFSFGWRQPVSAAVESALLDVMSEFPFPYEIKAETRTYAAA